MMIWSLLALPVTALLILMLRRYAFQLRLVDAPGGRKQHHGTVPLVGGLAMFGGVLIGSAAAGVLTSQLAMLGALSLVVMGGFLDDRHDLRPAWRFALQSVAVLVMVYVGGVKLDNLGNLLGFGDLLLGDWAVAMTVFGVLGVINAFNMIDGLDGLAGTLALIALACFAGFAVLGGVFSASLLLPLIGAVAGFLLFNARTPWRSRAAVFMGEAGSVLLGFALAWFAVEYANTRDLFTPITAVWILAVPLMDTVGLMLRRVLKGRSPLSADREHLHHVLLRAGFTTSQTVALVVVAQVVFAAIGILGWWFKVPEYVMFYSFLAIFSLYLFGVTRAWKLMKWMRKVRDGLDDSASDLRIKATEQK